MLVLCLLNVLGLILSICLQMLRGPIVFAAFGSFTLMLKYVQNAVSVVYYIFSIVYIKCDWVIFLFVTVYFTLWWP